MIEQYIFGSNYAETKSDLNLYYARDLNKQVFISVFSDYANVFLRKNSFSERNFIIIMLIKVNPLPHVESLLMHLPQRNFDKMCDKRKS